MPRYSTFHARIKVDDGELPEYDIQVNESEKQVSCWIPSEAGKNFSACWTNTSPFLDTGGWITLDGVPIGGYIRRTGSNREIVHSKCLTSSTTCRSFSFSPISYTDDDAYLHVSVANLGVIKIDIWSLAMGCEKPLNGRPPIGSDMKVHERSKKLGVHRVQFGEEQMIQYTAARDAKLISRLATFIFKYRPLDILQANGIAPPVPREISSQQVQANNKRKLPEGDVLEIKDDDEEDIDRRIKKLKEELQQLKARQAKKVKVERQDWLPPPNDVIDLT